jgi:hypothetical protein
MEEKETIKQPETVNPQGNPVKKQNRWTTYVREVIIGDFLSRGIFYKNIPFLIYLAIIALIYISNTYYAEKTFRQIEKTKNELKEIRFHYVGAKSTLMFYGKLSEISKRVKPAGLNETVKPPYKIFFDKDSLTGRTSNQQ